MTVFLVAALQCFGAFVGFLAACEGKLLHQWGKLTVGLALFVVCAYGLFN